MILQVFTQQGGVMCCFSRKVNSVSSTKIFARHLSNNRQALIYQMSVAADEPLAMILPIPVQQSAKDDEVVFHDLSSYETFFSVLEFEFPLVRIRKPPLKRGAKKAASKAVSAAPPPLTVHRVGSFVASFVPSMKDFSRLDPRFTLPAEVWASLPQYADYGFAVFQLDTHKNVKRSPHPMAFTFISRDPSRLFFPTVHIHDGEVQKVASFDHILYYQGKSSFYQKNKETKQFTFVKKPMMQGIKKVGASQSVASEYRARFTRKKLSRVDVTKTSGLVDGSLPAHRFVLRGSLSNVDHWALFEAPKKPTAKKTVKKTVKKNATKKPIKKSARARRSA
jgi:hypothetical protein